MSTKIATVPGNHVSTDQFEAGVAQVVARTNSGKEIRANVHQMQRQGAVFEIYTSEAMLRLSEVFESLVISLQDRKIYAGRAVVRGLVEAGSRVVCEVSLKEEGWIDLNTRANSLPPGFVAKELNRFLVDWLKLYRLVPDYKSVVVDLHTFLSGLQLWLEQVELRIPAAPPEVRDLRRQEIAHELRKDVLASLTNLFEGFELVSKKIEPALLPAHRLFAKRQLHPLLLCSPFMDRTFSKPLGYAGDYEMMSMIVRKGYEGGSIYAKLVNAYLLEQPPCEAVRRRVDFLNERIVEEAVRLSPTGRTINVFCVACGAAWEAVNFITDRTLANQVRFDLLDFNAETMGYITTKMREVIQNHGRKTEVSFIKNSVHNLLRAHSRSAVPPRRYDLIYCSGLYDYLNDRVCRSLNNHLYDLLLPGGKMVIGNFAPTTAGQNLMEHLMDWFLIYRDSHKLMQLAPEQAGTDARQVRAEVSGSNIFLEVRKPNERS